MSVTSASLEIMDTMAMPPLESFPDDEFLQMYMWWRKNKLQIEEAQAKLSPNTDILCLDSQLSMATSKALLDPALFCDSIHPETETGLLSHNISQHPSLVLPWESNFDEVLMGIATLEDTETSIQVDMNRTPYVNERKGSDVPTPSPQSTFDPNETPSHRPHSVTEKRYRANFNEKIAMLERLTSKRSSFKPGCKTVESSERKPDALGSSRSKSGKWRMPRQNKTAVLTQAINYIHDMEVQTGKLQDTVGMLKQRQLKAKEFLHEEMEVERHGKW